MIKKIRTYLVDLAKKNVFIRKILRKTKYILERIRYIYYYLFYKVDDKTIFFESFGGTSFSCSPKAIYNYLIENKEYKDYKFIWAFKDLTKDQ